MKTSDLYTKGKITKPKSPLQPTDKYTKYFYDSCQIVNEFLTKLYPSGDMNIEIYEGSLVDTFIGYGPFNFNEIEWEEKPLNVTYNYVVILEKPTSDWGSGQEMYFTNDEEWVNSIREQLEKEDDEVA